MEAVIGLFLIVAVAAMLTGGSRRTPAGGERPVTRIEVTPSGSARTVTTERESSSGGVIPVLLVLLSLLALLMTAR